MVDGGYLLKDLNSPNGTMVNGERIVEHRLRDGDTIATLGPGEFFGELSVLDGQPRTAQVVAAEPTVCLALSTWEFEAVVRERPDVALAIMRGLAARLRGLTEAHRH